MSRRARIIRLFLAGPSYTEMEKSVVQATVEDINRTHGREGGFRIDLLHWNADAYPAIGADGQDVINRQIGQYDIFLGLMSTRYGTPTGRASSGTVEEFDRAWARFLESPDSVHIMFYFRDPEVRLSAVDAYQLLQIQRFKRRVQELGVLHWTYDDPNELSLHLRNHLPKVVRDVLAAKVSKRSSKQRSQESFWEENLGSWHARRNVFPQWADYMSVPLEKYSARSYSLTGRLYSESPYFRFGFKLFALQGREFGDSAIQSRGEANLLVHVGKNADSSSLFLTSYYNGVRQGSNTQLLDYSPPRPVSLMISVSPDHIFTMNVDGNEVYSLHINPTIAERFIVVAWGDEHEFDVHFTDILLRVVRSP